MKKTAFVLLVVSCLVFGLVATAQAYWESQVVTWGAMGPAGLTAGSQCSMCHGVSTSNSNGPHGGFSSSTDSCKSCHRVHEAGSALKLLPQTTELGICMSCHDFSFAATGGKGVYGAIRAQGLAAESRHSIEGYNTTESAALAPANTATYTPTSTIPGGWSGALLPTASAGNRNLTCTHCHTPHGNTRMAAFYDLRTRSATPSVPHSPYTGNRILKDNLLETPNGTYGLYGAFWCAGCHKNRHDSSKTPSPVNNHPVVQATSVAFGATSQTAQNTTWGVLYVADSTITTQHLAGWSREATAGWAPECQQCHYNYMNVEQNISISSVDGTLASDNPRFQTFPHENMSRSFLVESGDDLCINCHPTVGLP